MADKPVGEVVAVDAVLDALSSPTSSDVYEALQPFSNDAAVASAASLALAGGGGGGGTGLPTGWTQDAADPANVASNSGDLDLGTGLLSAFASDVLQVAVRGIGDDDPATIQCINTDPTTGGGYAAALGSIRLRNNGQAWLKTGAGNTAWTQIGGQPASAVITVRVPFAFDTAGLVVTGITAYTPSAGEMLLLDTSLTVTEAWDGSSPGLSIYSAGDDPGDRLVNGTGLDAAVADGTHRLRIRNLADLYANLSASNLPLFTDSTPLKVMVDDGAGGDPVSTQGAAELVLVIATV